VRPCLAIRGPPVVQAATWSPPTSAAGRRARPSGCLLLYLDAHAAGGALDDLHRGVDVVGVEIWRLGLGDGADLLAGHRADLLAVGLAGTLVDAEGLAQQHGGRRRLGDEGEGAILVHGELDRHDGAAGGLRLAVERLAELQDGDAVLLRE